MAADVTLPSGNRKRIVVHLSLSPSSRRISPESSPTTATARAHREPSPGARPPAAPSGDQGGLLVTWRQPSDPAQRWAEGADRDGVGVQQRAAPADRGWSLVETMVSMA